MVVLWRVVLWKVVDDVMVLSGWCYGRLVHGVVVLCRVVDGVVVLWSLKL